MNVEKYVQGFICGFQECFVKSDWTRHSATVGRTVTATCQYCGAAQHSTAQLCSLAFGVLNYELIHRGRRTLCGPVVILCTTRFNIQQFYVLPTQCIYVFCVDLRTNSDYFPIQH